MYRWSVKVNGIHVNYIFADTKAEAKKSLRNYGYRGDKKEVVKVPDRIDLERQLCLV